MLPACVILDRDGVINEDSDHYIKSLQEWKPIPGSIAAIARLNHLGIPVAIATNQAGIGRGYYTLEVMHQIHRHLEHLLEQAGGRIEMFAYCPHHPDDACRCRKPQTGMLATIQSRCGFPLNARCQFVGDSFKDMQTAWQAGCTPVLVRSGKGEQTLRQHPELNSQVAIYDNLEHFANARTKEAHS